MIQKEKKHGFTGKGGEKLRFWADSTDTKKKQPIVVFLVTLNLAWSRDSAMPCGTIDLGNILNNASCTPQKSNI